MDYATYINFMNALTLAMFDNMAHALGFNKDQVKRGKYSYYRNYYCTSLPNDNWAKLESLGLASKGEEQNNMAYYHVTELGIKFMENRTNVSFIEIK